MKNIIIIVIVIIIIISIGYMFLGKDNISNNLNNQIQQTQEEKNGYLLSKEEAMNKVADKYKNSPEFKKCESNGVASCMREIIINKIRKTGDVSLCNDIPDANLVHDCKYSMAIEVALAKEDVEKCNILNEEEKDGCRSSVLMFLARKNMDSSLCEQLEEVDKKSCKVEVIKQKAIQEKDPKLCSSLDEIEKEMCEREVEIFAI